MSQANVELARRGYEAVARGDFDAIAELLDPDVKWHTGDPDAEYACHNRVETLAFMRANAPRRRLGQLVDVLDAGDCVVVLMQPPDEDGVTPPPRANVTRFRAGKVVEMVGYESPEAARAAAGLG